MGIIQEHIRETRKALEAMLMSKKTVQYTVHGNNNLNFVIKLNKRAIKELLSRKTEGLTINVVVEKEAQNDE